jgi:hypothetical protein
MPVTLGPQSVDSLVSCDYPRGVCLEHLPARLGDQNPRDLGGVPATTGSACMVASSDLDQADY